MADLYIMHFLKKMIYVHRILTLYFWTGLPVSDSAKKKCLTKNDATVDELMISLLHHLLATYDLIPKFFWC